MRWKHCHVFIQWGGKCLMELFIFVEWNFKSHYYLSPLQKLPTDFSFFFFLSNPWWWLVVCTQSKPSQSLIHGVKTTAVSCLFLRKGYIYGKLIHNIQLAGDMNRYIVIMIIYRYITQPYIKYIVIHCNNGKSPSIHKVFLFNLKHSFTLG